MLVSKGVVLLDEVDAYRQVGMIYAIGGWMVTVNEGFLDLKIKMAGEENQKTTEYSVIERQDSGAGWTKSVKSFAMRVEDSTCRTDRLICCGRINNLKESLHIQHGLQKGLYGSHAYRIVSCIEKREK